MPSVILAVFAVALITMSVLVLTSTSLNSAEQISLALDRRVHRNGDADRTDLSLVSADLVATSTNIDVSIRNTGQISLRNFDRWDVLLQYYATSSNSGLNIGWMSYTTSTPSATGEWTVRGPYLDSVSLKAEVYDPNVLNPGEEMIVRVNITPAIPTSTDNVMTIAEPGGVTISAPFSR